MADGDGLILERLAGILDRESYIRIAKVVCIRKISGRTKTELRPIIRVRTHDKARAMEMKSIFGGCVSLIHAKKGIILSKMGKGAYWQWDASNRIALGVAEMMLSLVSDLETRERLQEIYDFYNMERSLRRPTAQRPTDRTASSV